MLEQEEASGPVRVYSDKRLLGSRKEYGHFIRELRQLGLVHFTQSPKCEVGVFFVWKKNRASMRMILDCRAANRRFCQPPGVDLLSGEGLGRIEMEGEHGPGHFGSTDVADCFHRMRIEPPLSEWFSYPPGTAKEFNMQGQWLNGRRLLGSDRLWPCVGALPMGWAWSLFFVQINNVGLLSQVPSMHGSQLMTDRGKSVVLRKEGGGWHYVYVDNVGLFCDKKETAEERLADSVERFEEKGLRMHDTSVCSGSVEALGVEVDSQLLRTRLSRKRCERLRAALDFMLSNVQIISGRELEVILGHCTFAGLVRREVLSTWHAAYRYVQRHYWERAELWPSVTAEVR